MTAAKYVKWALITYNDENGIEVTQLAIVGENNMILQDSLTLGLSRSRSPQGPASDWVRLGAMKILNAPVLD